MYKILSLLISLTFLLTGCENNEKSDSEGKQKFTDLNVTIMIDLSDRISPRISKTQVDKDLQLIGEILKSFKTHIKKKNNAPATKDIIRIVVYPQGDYIIQNKLDAFLSVDFSTLTINEKKEKVDKFEAEMRAAIEKIYEHASNAKNFNGSDIFNFIKHQAVNYCVKPNYKNVLTIISDGYMYFQNAQYSSGNRYSYMLERSQFMPGLRKSQNLSDEIKKGDYGFLSTGVNLAGLEVVCLEFNAGELNPVDFDIMKIFWSDWFKDMKIEEDKIHIYRSDLVSNTISVIKGKIKPQ